jgi:hypothetical protein
MRRKLSAGLVVAACCMALLWAAPALAQRGGRPGPVHGPVYGPGYGGAHFGLGFYYGPYFGPYFGAVGANVRVQVQPKNAEVYVDGHLAGIVDEFDGMFQNLVVEPGTHEITIYLDGYKTIVQRLYLSVGSTYKIKGVMEKLAPGEPNEPRPVPAPEPLPAQPQFQEPLPAAPPAPVPQAETYAPASSDSRFGQVAIRVQPADAEIVIDGDPWKGPQGAERLVVHLSAGTHRVEIRKDGFDPFVTAVEIRKGEVTVLNVSLAKL